MNLYRYLFVVLGLVVLLAACGQPNHNPLNLHTKAGPGYITVSWENTFNNATSVVVKRAAMAVGGNLMEPFAKIATLEPDATSYKDTNVVAGVSYQYSIGLRQDDQVYRYEQQTGSIQAILPLKLKEARSTGRTTVLLSFNKRIDESTVAALSNYSITPELVVSKAELMENGTDISLTTAPQNDETYTVTLSRRPDSGLKDMAGYGLMADMNTATFAGTGMADPTPPQVKKVISLGNTTVQVTFSEPVSNPENASFYSIADGSGQALAVTAAKANDFKTEVILTTKPQADTSYTLTVGTITDQAGNTIDPAASSASFAGTPLDPDPDVTQPQLTDALSLNNTAVRVKFDEPMLDPENLSYYRIEDGSSNRLVISEAIANSAGTAVTLTTEAQEDLTYTVTVERITDRAGNAIDAAKNTVAFQGTAPPAVDTDGDGLSDTMELEGWTVTITLGNGTTETYLVTSNPNLRDSDSDGLSDAEEHALQSDPTLGDTDEDGLGDADEIRNYDTSPTKQDSDGDELSDGREVKEGTGPTTKDTDDDGLLDGEEVDGVKLHDGTYAILNPRKADTDGDGRNDGEEVDVSCNVKLTPPIEVYSHPNRSDSDGDTLNDGAECDTGTDPTNSDSDSDGVPDNEDGEPLDPKASEDAQTPTLTWLEPTNSGIVKSGVVTLQVEAEDNIGVVRVEFFVGDQIIGNDTDPAGGFRIDWQSMGYAGRAVTLRAVAYDAASNSAGAAIGIRVDGRAPELTWETPADGSAVRGAVTLTVNAIDNARVARVAFFDGPGNSGFLADGVLVTPDVMGEGNYSFAWDSTQYFDGDVTLRAVVFDEGGNTQQQSITVTVDNTLPEMQWNSLAASEAVNGNVILTVEATDNLELDRVEFKIGNQTYAATRSGESNTYTFEWDSATVASGAVTITAVAFDKVGNTFEIPRPVIVDNDQPEVRWDVPRDFDTIGGVFTLKVNVTDELGSVASVAFTADGTPLSPEDVVQEGDSYSIVWNTEAASNVAKLSVEACDTLDNCSENEIIVNVDNEPPRVSWNDLEEPFGGTVTLSVEAYDNKNLTYIDLFANNNPIGSIVPEDGPENFQRLWNSSGFEPGESIALKAVAYDAAGNNSEAVTSATIDDVLPTVSWINPIDQESNEVVKGDVELRVEATDNDAIDHIEFFADSAFIGDVDIVPASDEYALNWNSQDFSRNNPGVDEVTLSAVAYDEASNQIAAEITVTVDNEPPTVTWNSPAANEAVSGTVTLSVDASDNREVDVVQFEIDNSIYPPSNLNGTYTYEWDSNTVDSGEVIITVIAYDSVGNKTEVPRTVIVDNTAPNLEWNNPVDGDTVGGTVMLSVSGANLKNVSFEMDGSPITGTITLSSNTYTLEWNSSGVSDGEVDLQAFAEDAAGNQGATEIITVTVDNTAPTPTWESPQDAAYVGDIITLQVSVNGDAAGVKLFEDEATTPFATITNIDPDSGFYETDWDTENSSGAVTLKAVAYDEVGNETPAEISVTIDNTDPTLDSWGSPQDGDYVSTNNPMTLEVTASDNVVIDRVEFNTVDGEDLTLIGEDDSASGSNYSVTKTLPGSDTDGDEITLRTTVFDKAGNYDSSDITVTVDNTVPDVTLTNPDEPVSGVVTLSVEATDDGGGIESVELEIDGTTYSATQSSNPDIYEYEWDSTSFGGKEVTIKAVAYDAAGNKGESTAVTVTVDNTPPDVTLTDPGEPASGTVDLSANVADGGDIDYVEFFANGTEITGTVTISGGTYSISWDSTGFGGGGAEDITIKATAYDTAGNSASASTAVTVDNS